MFFANLTLVKKNSSAQKNFDHPAIHFVKYDQIDVIANHHYGRLNLESKHPRAAHNLFKNPNPQTSFTKRHKSKDDQ